MEVEDLAGLAESDFCLSHFFGVPDDPVAHSFALSASQAEEKLGQSGGYLW